MFIPWDVVLICLLLVMAWLCAQDETPEKRPSVPAPIHHTEPDFSKEPPGVPWLRLYQTIAIERGDWKMADIYRDEAARLVAQRERDRLAYNQALRDRILKG